jgi:precorrin-6Y C5,15-methyltransferase (decarboxylating)
LGVPHFDIRVGSAPEALAELPPPDAVFIGGSAHDVAIVEACWSKLKPRGRIVVNGVTLEAEARLLAAHARWGGSLTRIAIERADAIGGRTAFRPALPVLQWSARRGETS